MQIIGTIGLFIFAAALTLLGCKLAGRYVDRMLPDAKPIPPDQPIVLRDRG